MTTVQAVGGLCNRLRAILSWRLVRGPLHVIWPVQPTCHDTFEAVFEPLGGVTFVHPGHSRPEEDVWAPHPDAPFGWERAYADLVPVEAIRARVEAMVHRIGRPFAAMHVRRTDHVPARLRDGDDPGRDEDFFAFADRDELPLFLATDNGVTQARYRERYGSRLHVATPMGGSEVSGMFDPTRHSTLADGVVDMYVASYSVRFRGCVASSFSHTIDALRALRGLEKA